MKKICFLGVILLTLCMMNASCTQKKIASQKGETPTSEPAIEEKSAVVEPAKEAAAKVDSDLDKDGVINSADLCPDSPVCAPVNKKGCWVISDIVFEFDKAELLPEQGRPILDSVAYVMGKNPELTLTLNGHTCSMGPESYNQRLSVARANAAKEYLMSKGIAEYRLSANGFGESNPLVPNDTRANRARNRRVELKPSVQ